jgi:predicted ATPase
MRRIVVTGAPGTGKTSVVSLLGDRHMTVSEPARELIAEHAAKTGEATLDGRPELFLRRLVQRSIDDFKSVADAAVVFFDRGLPDCVAYAAVFGMDPEPIFEQANRYRYESPVFIAPPWKEIYTRDALRRATFAQVEAFDLHLRSAYVRLGYELIELPRASPRRRVELITEHLHPRNAHPSVRSAPDLNRRRS